MKVLIFSLLLVISSFTNERQDCDQLKFEVIITHTSDGLKNGIIEVIELKSTSKVKAFLYGDKKSKNRFNVKIDRLNNLEAGKYLLVLQNKDCSSTKRNLVIQ